MQKACKAIGWLVLILGIIGSIIAAFYYGRTARVSSISMLNGEYIRSWGKTIIIFLTGSLATVIQSIIFLALSEILEYLEAVYNMNYEAKNQNQKTQETKENTSGWKCSNCGKINPEYTGTCSCGTSKY